MGTTLPVIIDRAMPDEENVWVARSQADAPDIDCLVFVTSPEKELRAGDDSPSGSRRLGRVRLIGHPIVVLYSEYAILSQTVATLYLQTAYPPYRTFGCQIHITTR